MSNHEEHHLSAQERELEASLQQQLMHEEGEEIEDEFDEHQHHHHHHQYQYEEHDQSGHNRNTFDDMIHDQSYDEDGQPLDQSSTSQQDAALSTHLMQLNLNGGSLSNVAAPALSDPAGSSTADRGSSGEFPLFKVGDCIARSYGVLSCVKCDHVTGRIYLGSLAGEIIMWDFTQQKEIWRRRIELPGSGKILQITCLDVRGTKLAVGGAQGETIIFDTETFQITQQWLDHKQRISAIAWVGGTDSHPALQVYTTAHDGYFLVRDLEKKGKIIHSFITCTCPLSAMQVESPGIVYIGSWDGQVKKLDLERKQVVLVMKSNQNKESPIRSFTLAPSPALKKKKKGAAEELPVYILFIAHGIGEIKSWDMRTGKVHVDAYQGCTDVVNSMCTWNGKLYAAGDDRSVRMFDINTGVCLESLTGGHENGITCIDICGVTPVITPEMLEAQAAAAALSHRSSSRKKSAASRAGSAGPAQPQQGVGNELLLTTGFDGQSRSYKIAAIEAAIQLKLLKQEELKAAAFEAYVASKTKGKKKKKKSKKGSSKKRSRSSSAKKKSSTASPSSGSKKSSKKSSKAASKAGSKVATARSNRPASGASATSASAGVGTGELTGDGSAKKKKKKTSGKKKASAKKKEETPAAAN